MKVEIEKIITEAFNTLDKEINRYVVMNKYDVLPYELPSDIDICVEQSDFERLDDIIKKVAHNTNTIVAQKIWHNYRKCAYILTPIKINESFRLQLDFFSDFSVSCTPKLISYDEILNNTRCHGRFLVPKYELEYIFLLMRRIFKNDFSLEHIRLFKSIILRNRKSSFEYGIKYFDKDIFKEVEDAIINEDLDRLNKLQPVLWKNLRELSYKNSKGVYFFKYWASQVKRAIFRYNNPVGLSIAILAPDGGGKTTVIENISSLVSGSFHGVDVRYIRPRLFRNLGAYNLINPTEEESSNPNPHDKTLHNPLKSLIRFLFYNLDYQLGTLFDIKLKKVRKKLVIFDRYYYDYYVDMKRYQYKLPKFLPKVFEFTIPKPDIVFILDAPAEILYERKKELTVEELKRQRNEYRKIANNMKNAILIDASQEIEKVVQDITTAILQKKKEQTLKIMK